MAKFSARSPLFIQRFIRATRVGWFLAYRQIRRTGVGTTSLIIFIMVLTFINLVAVSGLLVGLIAGSFLQYNESYSGDVIITSAPGRTYIENSQNLLGFLDNHPRVQAVSPRYATGVTVLGSLTTLPTKDEKTNSSAGRIVGYDPLREESVTNFSRLVEYGEPLQPGDTGYILIGANLLEKYSSFADANIPGLDFLKDVDVGSRVRVTLAGSSEQAPNSRPRARETNVTEAPQVVSKEFIVKGIVKSKVDEVSVRMFVLDEELKRMLPINNLQYQEIAIITDDGYAEQLVRDVDNFMGNYDARIQTSEDSVPSFLRDIETTMALLGNALSSIALIVATITVFIVIFINAITKRKYIGIMKGIGISPSAIQISYVLQALFYGIGGSIIGVIITFGFLEPYFLANPIDFPFSDGILVATPGGAAVRILILLVVTLIAGYIPAKLIIRRNTLDAILGR